MASLIGEITFCEETTELTEASEGVKSGGGENIDTFTRSRYHRFLSQSGAMNVKTPLDLAIFYMTLSRTGRGKRCSRLTV